MKKEPIPLRGISHLGLCYCVVIVPFFLWSCSSDLDRESYIKWVQDYDNGLHVKKTHSVFLFDLQYQPADYVLFQRGAETKSAKRDNISNFQYYTLTISLKDNIADFIDYNLSNASAKQQKLYYFSYQFQDDLKLEENGKELPCVLFHFERPTNLNNSRTFVLGFESPFGASEEAQLVINSEYFSALPVKIKISKKNIPSIKV